MITLEVIGRELKLAIEEIMDEAPDSDTYLIGEFGMDDLDLFEAIMIVEDKLDIEVDDSVLYGVTTYKKLAKDIFNQLIN